MFNNNSTISLFSRKQASVLLQCHFWHHKKQTRTSFKTRIKSTNVISLERVYLIYFKLVCQVRPAANLSGGLRPAGFVRRETPQRIGLLKQFETGNETENDVTLADKLSNVHWYQSHSVSKRLSAK